MTIRVATVLSARDWEPQLVAHARDTGSLRIVLRAFQPNEIAERFAEIDVVVAGADVAWVTPALIASWRRLGLGVVGIHPRGDRPAADLLAAGGADQVLSDDCGSEGVVHAVRFLTLPTEAGASVTEPGRVVAVVGARGAPGTTEIALCAAWNAASTARTVIIDGDLGAPSLAIRLGVAPRPDLVDAAGAVRRDGALPGAVVHSVGRLDAIVGSHRPGEPPLRDSLLEEVVEAAAAAYERVFLDLSSADTDSVLLKRADDAVLVVDAAAVGVVRAAQLVAAWSGPPPSIVVNHVDARDRRDVAVAVRRWTGLEPAVFVRSRPQIRAAAVAARPPHRSLRRDLGVIR